MYKNVHKMTLFHEKKYIKRVIFFTYTVADPNVFKQK
jgi:hypothetical protein